MRDELDLGIYSPLAMDDADAMRLTRPERERRLGALIEESRSLLDEAIQRHVTADGRRLAGVVALFSGGNDSTVLTHMFRDVATHAAHANTTIGIESTRDFVRNTCEEWGLPLIERTPPRESDHYRALVLDQGFPGPAHHFKMFQRLKERALRQVARELNPTPRSHRLVFVAGRRRQESARRANVPEMERRDSVVWVSPLVNWTTVDMNTYRLTRDVPRNEVADLIHMSGECLCGAFAAKGEREEVSYWFPGQFEWIAELEAEIAKRDDIPDHRKTWGWGANRDRLGAAARDLSPSASGPLCSACDDRFQDSLFGGDAA